MEQQKRKRKKKQKWYAIKNGSVDGRMHIEASYDNLKKWFAPRYHRPLHKSFDTWQEAYNWLNDIAPPPPPKPSKSRPLF